MLKAKDHIEKQPPTGTPLNTILLWITLGVLSAIGAASWNNTIAMAKLEGSQVTRSEVDIKITEVKTQITSTQAEVAKLYVELAKIQVQVNRNETQQHEDYYHHK